MSIKEVPKAHVCSPNVFGQYFDPISLGLEQYGIPSSSCFANDAFIHPSTFSIVSYAFGSLMCPTSINVSCTSNCQMILVSNSSDPMLSRFEVGEGMELIYLVRDLVPKSWFLDIDEKEVDNENKGGWRTSKIVNYGRRMHLMNEESFVILIQQDQLLIFQKMNLLLRIWWICFHLLSCKYQKKMVACILQPSNFYLFILN